MRPRRLTTMAGIVAVLLGWSAFGETHAQPLLNTENLCGPGSGLIGTTWISLPTDGTLKTAEDLCASISPTPQTVQQVFPDQAGNYVFDCAALTCTSTGLVPEPGCTASTCFCIDPGEGIAVVASAPSQLAIYGCDAMIPINVPIVSSTGPNGALVSVPFHTFLTTFNDLGLWYGLPSTGISRGTVSGLDCTDGVVTSCSVGTASCQSALLVPGLAYRLRSPTTGVYSNTNPVTCMNPNPPPASCPVDGLMVSSSGGTNTLTWNPAAAGCPLPLTYQVARLDLACLTHYCAHCAACSILGTTVLTTLADAPPAGNWAYLVSVVGGTWNDTSATLCTDRDILFGLGCP